MFLLPLARMRLETAKEPEVVRQTLRAAIDGDVGVLGWLAPWTGRYVAGTVSDPWFRLVSRSRWRDFYLPVTEGSIARNGAATVVEAVIRPKLFDLAWVFGGVALILALSLAHDVPLWQASAMAGAAALLVHVSGCWGFARARKRVEELLTACVRP
jgi:hypothetical protein